MSSSYHRKSVLVTGGSGFIGRQLVEALLKQGADVTALSRHVSVSGGEGYKTIEADLTHPVTLEGVCHGTDIVFHLGGNAHAVDQTDRGSEEINQQVTVNGTNAILEQAIKAGVSRFVFFSSVKAMGEGGEVCLDETAECRPTTSYGRAKLEAEKLVLEAGRRGVPSTVLRLPMVYGPGCKGNLPRMIQAVARGRFPSLPETGNKRSLVDVRDVIQAALLVGANPIATDKVYIVTDDLAYSTRQIYEWICIALQRPVPRWFLPLSLLRSAAHIGDMIHRVSGRRFVLDTDALAKLTGSAWYSSEKIRRELNYRPTHVLRNSLPEMVAELGGKG